jgi:hypothetical protein
MINKERSRSERIKKPSRGEEPSLARQEEEKKGGDGVAR